MTFSQYYWSSFLVTFLCGVLIPSKKLSALDNVIGSLQCAFVGLLVWPFFVIALVKTHFFKEP